MRLGIDSRGRLFWNRLGRRWYANEEDNDLMELQSILVGFKPFGGSFQVRSGQVHYRTPEGGREDRVVALWFEPEKSRWRPPLDLNKPWTEEDNERFIRSLTER